MSDGLFPPTRPEVFFPDVPREEWQRDWADHLDIDGNLVLNLGCYLLRADGRTLLVDTGIGPGGGPGSRSGRLMQHLRGVGVEPEGIDLVLSTHMHFDHIGWNTTERAGVLMPTFPRARYAVQRREWDFWTGLTTPAAVERVNRLARPLERAGVLDLVEGERAVTPSVRFLPTPGHTPGHASVLIDSGGEGAVILGDVAYLPAQVTNPDWRVAGDVDPAAGSATRRAMWERVEAHGLTVCGTHFTEPNIGRLVQVEGRRFWRGL